MNLEKLNKELDTINEKIRILSDKKKELESRRQAALDAELSSVFKRKKIAQEQFLILNQLDEVQLKKILDEAAKMVNVTAPDKTGTVSNAKESTEE